MRAGRILERLFWLGGLSALFAAEAMQGQAPPFRRIPVERDLPKPLADHPGNVFLAGEEATVKAPEAAGATGWVCVDYEQKAVANGTERTAALGKLAVGYYEVWATDAAGKRLRKTTIGVVEPLKAPTPDDSPIAVDAAAAWFYNKRYGLPPNVKEAASLMALAGVNWARDRLAWPETEPERGKFAEHTFYDETAREQAAAGLQVLQVFHHSPAWANPNGKRFPLDLRDGYSYLKAMSARWRGQVLAWEPWNEADIDVFGGHTGAEIAAYQKAAFWGIRAGNPDAIVCQNVFAIHRLPITDNFAENEPWAYFDTMNFHHYSDTDAFPGYYAAMRKASGGRPLWVTEAGTHVNWEGDEKEQEPNWESQQRQARYVTQCFAASLHEGTAEMFYFLLPHYIEGKVQFGLTHKDLTPRPSYLALAAAGRLLAGAKPLGRLKTEGVSPLRAFAFRAMPDGQERIILVAWSRQGKAPLPLPSPAESGTAFDFLGRPLPAAPAEVGADPVYVQFAAGAEKHLSLVPPPAPAERIEAKPCPVVLQALLPPERTRLSASAYALAREEALDIPLFVYNFGDQSVTTEVKAAAEAGVEVAPTAAPVTIKPMERLELRFRASAKEGEAGGSIPVRFSADCGPQGRALAVLRLLVPHGALKPGATRPLKSAATAANWRTLVSPGKMTLSPAEGGGILVDAVMQPGDRWAYPILPLPDEERPASGVDGVAFTVVPLVGRCVFRAIFDEANGAGYFASAELGEEPAIGKPYPTAVLFRDCVWGLWSKPDPDGRLDPGQIAALKIGCNTKDEHVRFIVRDVAWVKR